MSSRPATTQLGRHFWTSVRDTFDYTIWRLPIRQQPSTRVGFSHFSYRPPTSFSTRSFFTSRPIQSPPSSSRLSRGSVRRSCTSGGLLLFGLSSPTSSTPTVVNTATAVADAAIISTAAAQKSNIRRLARQGWLRSIHPSGAGVVAGRGIGTRSSSSGSDGNAAKPPPSRQKSENKPESIPDAPKATPDQHVAMQHPDHGSIANSMSKYIQTHMPHLPRMPHRPAREELLAAANGFWERLKVRFKWASIRSMRPWNADEWGAFLSWFVFGHLVWILVGTTTFMSLVILTVNTVFAQEELAKWVGDYLTQSAGITVIFESAIVPKWKDGVITFRNVFVSRRPGQTKSSVKKGSSTSAAAEAAAKQSGTQVTEEDDGNYTQFDITINTVNVTLSFVKWWNGKGMLKDVEVKGVRGVVDRTHVHWSGEKVDPLSYRHTHQPGDFEIEHFKLEDLLVTIHQPNGFRPFSASIFSCELPQLRKQFLFYDLLSASHMSGSYDGSLFTIHPRQIHGVAAADERGLVTTEHLGEPAAWKKFSRIRIDGLKIDHLNRGVEGPFGWIYEGNVDIVADVMFPVDIDESIGKVMSDFYDKLEEAVTSNRYLNMLDTTRDTSIQNTDHHNHLEQSSGHLTTSTEPSPPEPSSTTDVTTIPSTPPLSSPLDDLPRYLVMDLRLHLNDVRAAVPFFPPSDSLGHTASQTYINAALIRPIVAYINAKRTYIPIACRVVKRASDFDGSWSVWDCGLLDDTSAEVYEAFARDVEDQHSRVRRLKKVGFWTLSMFVHALLAGVAGDLM